MGFNQFSRAVTPVDQYLPISDELLTKGAVETYNKAGQLGQKLLAYKSNLFGISTYGKDAEVLQDYENQFNQQVAELSKGDITSPQALSKFNSLVSNFSNSPDILGIHERNAAYTTELKNKKEAEAKNLTYTSPLLKDAEKYYSGDKYYSDKRFSRSGWVSPETTKAMDEAVKSVTKQQYDPKTGFVTKIAKPEEVAAAFYERMKSNPNYQKDLEYGFEQETEGVNWQDNGQQFVQGKVNKLTQQYNEALADGNQEAASLAQHELNRLQNLADPSLIGEELKKQAFQNHIKSQLERVGYANDVSDFQKIERDPIDMKLLEHKLRMQEKSEKESLKMYGIKKAIDATIASGQTPDYEAIDIGDYSSLIYNPIESRDGKSGTPATGKTIEQKAAEDAAKAEEERIKKIPVATKEQIQQLYKNNKTFENNFNTWMTKNGYPPKNFTATDIEKVEPDDKTQTYKLTLDTDYMFGGGSKVIDISKQEFEKLKSSKYDVNIPNSSSYQKKADLGNWTLVYSNDGVTYYDDNGVEYDNQGNKK